MKIPAGRCDSTSFVNSSDLITFHVLVIVMHDFPIQHHPDIMINYPHSVDTCSGVFYFVLRTLSLLVPEQCKIALLVRQTHRANIVSNGLSTMDQDSKTHRISIRGYHYFWMSRIGKSCIMMTKTWKMIKSELFTKLVESQRPARIFIRILD